MVRRSRSDRRASGPEGRKRWWRNLWLRAGLLHPLLFVGPWVIAALVLAHRSGSKDGDVDWVLKVLPVAALVSVIATIAMVADDDIDQATRSRVIGLGLLGSLVAFMIGFMGWLAAADTACHGLYECPF